MLLLLSYCSVFKVQNCYAILPTNYVLFVQIARLIRTSDLL